MLRRYASPRLKHFARQLRRDMTDAEIHLWARLRRRQVAGVQFYRQRPLGNCIADFYAPAARLVVEIDGSQHAEHDGLLRDERRSAELALLGLRVLRFDNRQVLLETDAVMDVIAQSTLEGLAGMASRT